MDRGYLSVVCAITSIIQLLRECTGEMYACNGRLTLLSLAFLAARACASAQQPLQEAGSIVDDNFGAFVEGILAQDSISGISAAVIRPDGKIELGGWGIRSEDGDAFGADVSMHGHKSDTLG
jgi:hypothetical protein